jgi:hypothetical protein
LLPGCGIAREPGNLLALRDGQVIAGLSGKSLIVNSELDDDTFSAVLTALMKLRPKLTLENIGGLPALESPWARSLAAIGFHSNGRALIYDGLPGPTPAIARAPILAAQH